jgi:concanavalin A-like lectin/glucanase superfamily protein
MHVVSGKDRPGTGRSCATWRSTTAAALAGLTLLLATQAAVAAESDGLARWPMDEGTGQVAADVSGNGHHARLGRLAGADPSDPGWVPGRSGTALRFVGAQDQFAEIGQPGTLAPGSVTVEAWVRRAGTPGEWRYVISKGSQGCNFSSFALYSGGGGGLSFYVADGGRYVASPEAPQERVWDGGWHYAVGTYDGQHVRLYLDGSEVGSGSPTGLSIDYGLGTPGAFIGTYRGGCDLPFTGDVDEVAIRDRALGAAEIAELARRSGARPIPPQQPPVSGAPATGRSAPPHDRSSEPSPAPGSCFAVRVTPGRVVVHRRTRLRVSVRRRGRAAAGVRVTVGGLGVRASARTMRRGRAHLFVRSRRSGRLRVTVGGQPRGCAVRFLVVRPKPGG